MARGTGNLDVIDYRFKLSFNHTEKIKTPIIRGAMTKRRKRQHNVYSFITPMWHLQSSCPRARVMSETRPSKTLEASAPSRSLTRKMDYLPTPVVKALEGAIVRLLTTLRIGRLES